MSEERREKDLAEVLGVSRDALRRVRKGMAEEMDWFLGAEGITYTDAGYAKLRHELQVAELPNPAPEKRPEPELVEVKVTRLLPHPKRMLCDYMGQRVVVQVRENKNFMPGMMITVLPNDESVLWHYRGPLPKRKGKL